MKDLENTEIITVRQPKGYWIGFCDCDTRNNEEHIATFPTYPQASEAAERIGRYLGIGWTYRDSDYDFDSKGNRLANIMF